MPNANHVFIAGHIGRDPELKHTKTGIAVCTFSVAIKKEWEQNGEKKEATTWVDCKAWREVGERVAQKFGKGSGVYVTGEITVESWEDKTTQAKRSKMLVTVNSIAAFMARKKEGQPDVEEVAKEAVSKPESIEDEVPFN